MKAKTLVAARLLSGQLDFDVVCDNRNRLRNAVADAEILFDLCEDDPEGRILERAITPEQMDEFRSGWLG